MKADDIIGEIHQIREKLAAECDFDPKRMGERIRRRQRERARQGVRYVSFVRERSTESGSAVVREEPGQL